LKAEPYIATQTYKSSKVDEISIDQGAFIDVLEKNHNGWWTVKYNGAIGVVPALYLTPNGQKQHDINTYFSGFTLPQRDIKIEVVKVF
jgi:hypothetical protein